MRLKIADVRSWAFYPQSSLWRPWAPFDTAASGRTPEGSWTNPGWKWKKAVTLGFPMLLYIYTCIIYISINIYIYRLYYTAVLIYCLTSRLTSFLLFLPPVPMIPMPSFSPRGLLQMTSCQLISPYFLGEKYPVILGETFPNCTKNMNGLPFFTRRSRSQGFHFL